MYMIISGRIDLNAHNCVFYVIKIVNLIYLGDKVTTMDPSDPEPLLTPAPNKNTKRELTCNERQHIVSRLMFELQERGVDGKFLCGTLKLVAGEFHVIPQTITRVWARACMSELREPTHSSVLFKSPEKEVWEETQKWKHDEVREAVKLIPLFRRRTIWDLAHALNIQKSTLF
jgi:hypothetical protein